MPKKQAEVLKALLNEPAVSFSWFPTNGRGEIQILLGDAALVLKADGRWELV